MALDLPDGSTCFVDANILHYALLPGPPVSEVVSPFIDRLRHGTVIGVVTTHVLSDVQHKLIMSLLVMQRGLPRERLLGWVKKHPEALVELQYLDEGIQRLRSIPLTIENVDTAILDLAVGIVQSHGLMMSDAIISAVMQINAIEHIVTNDDDFGRLPGITVWKPR